MPHPPDQPPPTGRSVFDVGPDRDAARTSARSPVQPPDPTGSPELPPPAPRSRAAFAAGVTWLACGLASMGSFAVVVLPALDPGGDFDPMRASMGEFAAIGLASLGGIPVGLILLWAGWSTVGGRSRDPLVNAISSFALAFAIVATVVALVVMHDTHRAWWGLLGAAALTAAGVLGLIGRRAHVAWSRDRRRAA